MRNRSNCGPPAARNQDSQRCPPRRSSRGATHYKLAPRPPARLETAAQSRAERTPTMRRLLSLGLGLALLAVVGTACLTIPGTTSQINLVSSSTVNGWQYDFYRNSAYPCSISGYQTFVVGTKTGSSPTGSSPLWVWMHGGGVGYFDSSGTPQPDGSEMTENSAASLQATLTNAGLSANVQADPAGFRMLAVSYCNRDIYSGTGQTDPNNPNKNTDGSARTTNGLQATKAAIAFA